MSGDETPECTGYDSDGNEIFTDFTDAEKKWIGYDMQVNPPLHHNLRKEDKEWLQKINNSGSNSNSHVPILPLSSNKAMAHIPFTMAQFDEDKHFQDGEKEIAHRMNFTCIVCEEYTLEPWSSMCGAPKPRGHTMCPDCLRKNNPGVKNFATVEKCGFCHALKPKWYLDGRLAQNVSDLKVKCVRSNCKWPNGTLDRFLEHVNEKCEWRTIACPNKASGCAVTNIVGDIMNKHVNDFCPFTESKCQACSEVQHKSVMIQRRHKSYHDTNDCVDRLVSCSLCVHASMKAILLEAHKLHCPGVLVMCKYGCRKQFRRDAIDAHEKDSSLLQDHLASLLLWKNNLQIESNDFQQQLAEAIASNKRERDSDKDTEDDSDGSDVEEIKTWRPKKRARVEKKEEEKKEEPAGPKAEHDCHVCGRVLRRSISRTKTNPNKPFVAHTKEDAERFGHSGFQWVN